MDFIVREYEYYLLPPANFSKEIDRLNTSLYEERVQHMYLLAEFRNYRRHVENNSNNRGLKVRKEDILQLLEILDDLENALRLKTDGEHSPVKSVQIIQKKLVALLTSQNVEPLQKDIYDLY